MRLIIDLQGAQGSSHARGIGRYSRELAMAMARDCREHEIVISLSGAWPDIAEDLSAAFSRILPRTQIRVWTPPTGIAALQNASARRFAEGLRAQFLASLQPDLVHVSSMFEGLGDDIVTWLPPRLERLPVVATCYDLIPLIRHNEYFGASGVLSPGTHWYYRCAHEMSLCEGLLAISESSRGEAISHLPFPADRVFNVQAGVSTAFRPAVTGGEARTALLRRYGLQDDFVLFLGAGDIRKNEAGLVAAYAQLPAALRDRHPLVIVGRTDEAALRKSAVRLGVPADSLVILPFAAEGDLNRLYSACALFIFPSLHEGFGLPVAEAMACGAPAIASNTSSLPEVVGRADATFDPRDPASMAACMRRVLENPALRAELAAHGPVQAGRFTWPSTAARAWDALEQLHDRRVPRDRPVRGTVLLPRPRLAFVSPLPPQASGIADYSRDLLPSLARYYDITVVSEMDTTDIRLQPAFRRLDPGSFLRQAQHFDRVLYQIGNSSFHRYQIEDLLPNCPGVVVLHDAFLSDYVNWLAHEEGRPDSFRAALWRSHGYGALRYDAEHGRAATLARYPCCLPVLQSSLGVIQHSRHGVDILRQHFGETATQSVSIIPLVRAVRTRPERAAARAGLGIDDDDFVVVSFGSVTALKCPDVVADAWRQAGLSGRLVFAGSAPDEFRHCVKDAAARISCTGRLTPADYAAWLSAADVAVQWRKGSRGESSAAVADALMAGVPTIVNRHGSAAELPADVAVGLPCEADAAQLAEAIISLHSDRARCSALSAAARDYATRELAPESIARRYRDAIEQAYATVQPGTAALTLAPEIEASLGQPGGLVAAVRGIADSLPNPWRAGGHPRLLIDMSELARRDSLSGIQRVVREIGRRVLETPPFGRQGGAARVHDGRLRHTHDMPFRLLGHAGLSLPETPVDAGEGDVLLCADVNAEMTPAEFAELRRLRLAGMRIVLVVYDLLPLRHPELFPPVIGQLVADWYTRMLCIADVAACISRFVADDLAAWLDDSQGVRKTRLPIGFFHLGADFPAESNGRAVSPEIAAALVCAQQRPTVVVTGTVEPRKGCPQALAAFEHLWQDGVDIGLTIVGKQGWQMEEFAGRLRDAPQLGDRLHWLERCADAELRQLYGASSGLLMASSHEGFGLPIIEAARAGLPVMARDLPVFREVAGEHARYFNGTGADTLAEALRGWMADGFSPSPAGMAHLSWDESFHRLCTVIFEEDWHRIWHPKG